MNITAYFLAWCGTISAILALSAGAEDVYPELRKKVSGLHDTNLQEKFIEKFDKIFGERFFSWRCYAMSSLASFVAVLIFVLLWCAMRPEAAASFLRNYDLYEIILIPCAVTFIFNFTTDYVSLRETRWVIKIIKDTKSPTKIIGFLFLDIILTVLIILVLMGVFSSIMFFGFCIFDNELNGYWIQYYVLLEDLYYGITLNSSNHSMPGLTTGIWLYSTFFTSIWVWLFISSGLILKTGYSFGLKVDIKERPIRSIGYISVIIVTIGFLIGALPMFLF